MPKLKYMRLVFSCLLMLLLVGCQLSTSPFAQAIQNAGAIFAAARVTLNSVHTGKMTQVYATASFAGYLHALRGTRKRLLSAQNGLNTNWQSIHCPFLARVY